MRIEWKIDRWPSIVHCAQQLCSLHLVPSIHDWAPLRQVAPNILECFIETGLTAESQQGFAWHCLNEAAMQADSSDEIAEHWLSSLPPSHRCGTTLARALERLSLVFHESFPNLEKQLEWRMHPLREQWEAYGPGLLAHLRRLVPVCRTESKLPVDLFLLQPICGGFGQSHPMLSAVRMEAVLTNPLSELPEVVRLGWLLGIQTVTQWDGLHSFEMDQRLPLASLALLPPMIAASQVVELSKIDLAHLSLAIEQWLIATPFDTESTARLLLRWWDTYLQTKPDWNVALSALHRALDAGP